MIEVNEIIEILKPTPTDNLWIKAIVLHIDEKRIYVVYYDSDIREIICRKTTPKQYRQIQNIVEDDKIPAIDSLWQHYTGIQYRVVLYTNGDGSRPDYPKTIVYKNIRTGDHYSRPLSDWHRSMTEI